MTTPTEQTERNGLGEFDDDGRLRGYDEALDSLVPPGVSVDEWWTSFSGSLDKRGDTIVAYQTETGRPRYLISVIGSLRNMESGGRRYLFTARRIDRDTVDLPAVPKNRVRERDPADGPEQPAVPDTHSGDESDDLDAYLVEMSYRLRTPLSAIVGYAEMLLDAPEDPDDVSDLAHGIKDASESLVDVIQSLEDQVARERARRKVSDLVRSLSTVMASTLDFEKVLDVIQSCIEDLLEFDRSEVLFKRDDGFDLIARRSSVDHDSDTLAEASISGEDPRIEQLQRTRKPLLISDSARRPDLCGDSPDFGSWLGVPLVWGDEVIGVLTMESSMPGAYDEFDVELVSSLGAHAGLAIVNARQYEQARQLADVDGLTRAVTRRRFEEVATDVLNRAIRTNQDASLMLMDLDHFKPVNDTYGHAAGDFVLHEFVRRCKSSIRDDDVIGRYGGEEFALLVPGLDIERACKVAERLRRKTEENVFTVNQDDISVTVSIGVAQLESPDDTLDTLLARADNALYKAKRRGRNRVEC